MNEFYNVNIVFRCSASLKDKLKTLAEAQDQPLSKFVRNACVEAMKRPIKEASQ